MIITIKQPDLASHRDTAVALVNRQVQDFTAGFTKGYSAEELASWPVKAEAARLHLAGTPQPLIEAEAAETGEDPVALAQLIVGMATSYELIIAQVTGLRRSVRDAILAAATIEEVDQALIDAEVRIAALIASSTPQ